MDGWILKMLLKVFKPFAKIAIIGALFQALLGALGGEDTDEDADTETPVEGEE